MWDGMSRSLEQERKRTYELRRKKVKSLSRVQLCDPMDCSPPGSSVHGIFQARIPEWAAVPSPGNLSDPGIEPRSPTLWADSLPSEPPGNLTSVRGQGNQGS